MNYQDFLDILWQEYKQNTPSATKIQQLLIQQEETLVNDHIAFRTVDLPNVGLNKFSSELEKLGYYPGGEYYFPEKKLKAKHFEHKDQGAPKIFVSELILSCFSQDLQDTITSSINQIPVGLIKTGAFLYSGRTWGTIAYKIYLQLAEESEYAAWLYVFGYCANHFTVDVGQLKYINTLEKMNQFLEANNIVLNNSGGEIKGTRKDLLQQSSIMADQKFISFAEGTYKIPSCYYEFAFRYKKLDGQLFTGFIASSADKIFESTNNPQN